MQKDICLGSTNKMTFGSELRMSNSSKLKENRCQVSLQQLGKNRVLIRIWVYGYFLKSLPFCTHVLPNPRIPAKVSGFNSSQMYYFRNASTKVPFKCIPLHVHDLQLRPPLCIIILQHQSFIDPTTSKNTTLAMM